MFFTISLTIWRRSWLSRLSALKKLLPLATGCIIPTTCRGSELSAGKNRFLSILQIQQKCRFTRGWSSCGEFRDVISSSTQTPGIFHEETQKSLLKSKTAIKSTQQGRCKLMLVGYAKWTSLSYQNSCHGSYAMFTSINVRRQPLWMLPFQLPWFYSQVTFACTHIICSPVQRSLPCWRQREANWNSPFSPKPPFNTTTHMH